MLFKFRGVVTVGMGAVAVLWGAVSLLNEGIGKAWPLLIGGVAIIWWGRQYFDGQTDEDTYFQNHHRDQDFQAQLFRENIWNTVILIALNIVPFYLINMTYGEHSELNRELALSWGANSAAYVATGQIWRLLTSMFLHADIVHILGNIIALVIVGRYIDYYFGTKNFYFIYFVAGLAGSLCSNAVHPAGFSVGASGAIFGMYGAFFMTFFIEHPDKEKLQFSRYAIMYMATHILKSLAKGFGVAGIDNAAHLGGFAAGAALAYLILTEKQTFEDLAKYSAGALMALLVGLNLTVFRGLPSSSQLRAMELQRKEWTTLAEHGAKYAEELKHIETLFTDLKEKRLSLQQASASWETRIKPELEAVRTGVYYSKVTGPRSYQAQLDLYNSINLAKSYFGGLLSPNDEVARRTVASTQGKDLNSFLSRAVQAIQTELEAF